MPQGDYKPKFKLGETVICTDNSRSEAGVEFIVVFTYLSIRQYSPFYNDRPCPPEYSESDANTVIYAVLERCGEGCGRFTQYTWYMETALQLFCSNTDRGKRILLEPANLQLLSDSYAIRDDALEKLTNLLQQPSET